MNTNGYNNFSLGVGAIKDTRDNRDLRLCSIQEVVAVPPSFTLEDLFPSKHQFSRGSCTSQAQSHHKERQEKVRIAARPIMAWTKELEGNKEYGAMTRNTFKIVNTIGCCAEEECPEPGPEMSWNEYIDINNIPRSCLQTASEHKSGSYWRVENNIDAIKQALFNNKNSVVISMDWHAEFNRPQVNGVLTPYNENSSVGGHAVEIDGWDDEKLLLEIKNSWSPSWGLGGKFFLPYEYFKDLIWDAWCSLDIPANMPVDERYGMKRTWTSYMYEKKMAFDPWLRSKIKRNPNNREINGLAYGYWDYESVFLAKNGDLWLKITKPEAIKRQLIK
jgi:C1A family cysteine protease